MQYKSDVYLKTIVDAWPSVREMSRELNVNDQAVYQWINRSSIPKSYWAEVLHAYNKRVESTNAIFTSDLAKAEHEDRVAKASLL